MVDSQHQGDPSAIGVVDLQRFLAVPGGQNVVAASAQNRLDQVANQVLILDNEDALRTAPGRFVRLDPCCAGRGDKVMPSGGRSP